MCVFAAALLGAACGDTPTEIDTRPMVRFVNATTGLAGNVGFTADGQFVTGSALGAGQAMASCARLDAGTASFGFGLANAGGTALMGTAITTLDNQPMVDGGNYTVVATGSATAPTLLAFDNAFSLGESQAAVRFGNFVPSTGTTAYNYFFYKGEVGSTVLATNLSFGAVSAYQTVTSGDNLFSALQVPGHTIVVPGSTFTLPGGSVSLMALVLNSSGGFQLLHLPRCS